MKWINREKIKVDRECKQHSGEAMSSVFEIASKSGSIEPPEHCSFFLDCDLP